MRLKRLILAATGGVLVVAGFAVPSEAGLTTFCDGVASDVTVPGDLVVKADASCELTNVTINGNATVRASGNLLLTDSTVDEALRVNDDAFASLVNTEVQGATRLNTAYGVYSEDSSHGLNVVANSSEFYYTLGTTLSRNLNATGTETFLESSRVSQSVNSDGSLLTDLYDSVVGGSLSVTGAELGSVVCLSEVDGDATFSGNSSVLQIGGKAPVADCGYNVFGGSLNLADNAAESFVTDNVVRGDLTCSGNDPAPVLSGNRVRGDLLCETGGAAALSSKSSAANRAEDRKDEVLGAIEDRVAVSEDAAEEAGPAFE